MLRTEVTKADEKAVCTLYSQDLYSYSKIANECSMSSYRVKKILNDNNVDLRTPANAQKVTYNPFLALEDDATQYWLWFLAADGSIGKDPNNTIALHIGADDKDHLQKYCDFIGNIGYRNVTQKDKKGKTHYSVIASFANKDVKEYLHSIGLTNKKSFTCDPDIPLTWAAIRGFTDGDGSVSNSMYKTTNRTIVSYVCYSDQLLHKLRLALLSAGIGKHTTNTKSRRSEHHIIQYANINDVVKFYINMYKGATVWLERKRDKFWENDRFVTAIEKIYDTRDRAVIDETIKNMV